jgi:hypothetical protein
MGGRLSGGRSLEVEVGAGEFLVDPGPPGRCEVEPVFDHLVGPHADEVEVAGVGEPAGRVGGVGDGTETGAIVNSSLCSGHCADRCRGICALAG